MKDFLNGLDDQLQTLATQFATEDQAAREAPSEAAPTAATSAPKNGLRRGLLGGGAALVAAVAAAFVIAAPSSADLPILETPTNDASALRTAAPEAVQLGMDFTAAHRFSTPNGPGYALVNSGRQTLCILVPASARADEFGTTCGPLARAKQRGTSLQLFDAPTGNQAAANLLVFVLPEGADGVRLHEDGASHAPRVTNGVVVERLRNDAMLTWTVAGMAGASETFIARPRRSGQLALDCGDGTAKTVDAPAESLSPKALGDALRALRKTACG